MSNEFKMYHLENTHVQISRFYFQPLSSSAPLLSDHNQGFICLLSFLVVAFSYYEMTQKNKNTSSFYSPQPTRELLRNCMLLTSGFTKRKKKSVIIGNEFKKERINFPKPLSTPFFGKSFIRLVTRLLRMGDHRTRAVAGYLCTVVWMLLVHISQIGKSKKKGRREDHRM